MLRAFVVIALASSCGSSSEPVAKKSSAAKAAVPPGGPITGECPASRGAACWTSVDGFRSLQPLPVGNPLRAVHVMPDGDAWVVGDDATLLRIAHGDNRITRITVPGVPTLAATFDAIERGMSKDFPGSELMKLDFKAIVGTSASDVWIAAGDRDVFHWDGATWRHYALDGFGAGGDKLMLAANGTLWAIGHIVIFGDTQQPTLVDPQKDTPMRGPTIPNTDSIAAIGRHGDDVWVASDKGTLFRSRAGAAFQPVPLEHEAGSLHSMWLDPNGSAGFLIAAGELFQGADEHWKPVAKLSSGANVVSAAPGGDPAWIVGEHVWRYTHGELGEVPIDGLTPGDHTVLALGADRFEAVDARAADDVWVVGRAGMILHYDGKSLVELALRASEDNAIGVVWTGDDAWLAAFADGVLVTGNLRSGIVNHERGPFRDPRAMATTLSGDVILAGCHTDMVARRGDGEWKKLPKLDACVSAIGGADKDHLWAVGSAELVDGKAWRLEHGRWRAVPTGMGEDDSLRDVAVASNGDVWIVGDGAMFVARKGGALTRVFSHKTDDYRGLSIRAPDDVWIATNANDLGSAGTLLHWDGKTFERFDHLTANFLDAVVALPNGAVYAVGLGGVATYSADGKMFRAMQTDSTVTLSHLIAKAPGTAILVGDYGTIMQRGP